MDTGGKERREFYSFFFFFFLRCRPPAPVILFLPRVTINPLLVPPAVCGVILGGKHEVRGSHRGSQRRGYYIKHIAASGAPDCTHHVFTHTHTRAPLFSNFFILHECLTNLSVRACQPVRTQRRVAQSAAGNDLLSERWTTWVHRSSLPRLLHSSFSRLAALGVRR